MRSAKTFGKNSTFRNRRKNCGAKQTGNWGLWRECLACPGLAFFVVMFGSPLMLAAVISLETFLSLHKDVLSSSDHDVKLLRQSSQTVDGPCKSSIICAPSPPAVVRWSSSAEKSGTWCFEELLRYHRQLEDRNGTHRTTTPQAFLCISKANLSRQLHVPTFPTTTFDTTSIR